MTAPIVAYPFGLYDCCPTTDGAAAVVVCRSDLAKEYRDDYMLVKGVGLSVTSGRPFMDPTYDYLGFQATQHASAQAYAMAGITDPLAEIDVAEVHDCFTWTEITNYEDLGPCPQRPGRGPDRRGPDRPGRRYAGEPERRPQVVRPPPSGPAGCAWCMRSWTQLRGQAGLRQVADPRLGLVHNVGGPGAVSCVAVLGQP